MVHSVFYKGFHRLESRTKYLDTLGTEVTIHIPTGFIYVLRCGFVMASLVFISFIITPAKRNYYFNIYCFKVPSKWTVNNKLKM